MDDHTNANMLSAGFFANVRAIAIEISESKGQFQTNPAKIFSNSSNVATGLNVGYIRGALGMKFGLKDDNIVLTSTLTAVMIVLSKSDAGAMAEMDEVEMALQNVGRKTTTGGASGSSTSGAPAAKWPKFSLGKNK